MRAQYYTLHNEIPRSDRFDSTSRVHSDILFADWAGGDRADRQALTLYMPQPYDMAQQFLFNPNANKKFQERLQTTLPPYLKTLGLSWDDVEGVRLTRYGHTLPVARAGHNKSGLLELAHRPFPGIHFAGQCNWANPCFETAFETARRAAIAVTA